MDCTYLYIWVNKVKIRAIVDIKAPINVILTCFTKKLGIDPDIDFCKEFGIAGLQFIFNQGFYSALPF